MAPPGDLVATDPDSYHMEPAEQPLTVESALRHADRICAALGLGIQYRKLHQIVRGAVADSVTIREFTRRVVSYADPTGERAVRNVMRGMT